MKNMILMACITLFSMQSFASKWAVCTASNSEKNMILNINTLDNIDLALEQKGETIKRMQFDKIENQPLFVKISNSTDKSIVVILNENYNSMTIRFKGKVTNKFSNIKCSFAVSDESDEAQDSDESNDSDGENNIDDESSFNKAFNEAFEASRK